MATSLPVLPEIERLSARVIRILGGNPSKFTLQGTNTYLVGQGPRRLLIDTGEGKPSWIQAIKSILASEKASIDRAICTHWHGDHVGGIDDLKELYPNISIHKNQPSTGQEDISDGQKFEINGATLKAFHCPGHTKDHMALVLEEEDAMFTGDNVLGHGTAVFEDLATYIDSLEHMHPKFAGRAYPGHGAVIEDGKAKILEYIQHRKEREEQVLAVLRTPRDGDKGSPKWNSMDIVKVIYKDYPENLYEAAEKGVIQVLEKLVKEKKVIKNDDDTWSLTGTASL